MHSYLQPQDDGLPMRLSGSWVAEKLDYLERYINIFETSMHSKPWRERHYIDLFAGSGKCVTETGVVYQVVIAQSCFPRSRWAGAPMGDCCHSCPTLYDGFDHPLSPRWLKSIHGKSL